MINVKHICDEQNENYLHDALGLSERRAMQITRIVDNVLDKEGSGIFCEIDVYRKVITATKCTTPEEVAYVSYIFGACMGKQGGHSEAQDGQLAPAWHSDLGDMNIPMSMGDMEIFKNAG